MNLFTIAELRYRSGWTTKGLLAMDDALRVVRPKRAWFAAQQLCSTLDGRVRDFVWSASISIGLTVSAYGRADRVGDFVTIWMAAAAPSERDEWVRLGFEFRSARFIEPVWVDFRTGVVRAIPEAARSRSSSGWRFLGVPG